jgi:hypothetical protein
MQKQWLFVFSLVLGVVLPLHSFSDSGRANFYSPYGPLGGFSSPKIIQEFRAAGLDVAVTPPPAQDSLDFEIQYNKFLILLAKNKNEVLKRKEFFQQLDITYFNHLDSFNKILSLNVYSDEFLLKEYWRLFDQRTAFEKEVGILLDLGIEVFSNNEGLDLFQASLKDIQSEREALKTKRNLLKRIFVDDFYSYKVGDKFLFLDRANLKNQLVSFISQSKVIANFVEFARSIGIVLSGDLDFALSPVDFSKFTNSLLSIKPELEFLVKTKVITELEINSGSEAPGFFERSKRLEVYDSYENSVSAIQQLAFQYSLQVSWNKPIKNTHFTALDQQYELVVERLKKYKDLIESKLSRFDGIYLQRNTSLKNRILSIGFSESDEQFEKIISSL